MYNISANTIFTGKSLVYLPTCHSTNEYASKLLMEENPPEGTVVITPNQTAGKGQRGTRWESEPDKNLTFSIILKPDFLSIKDSFYLNIISSLAVKYTLEGYLSLPLKVKWPNDIYLNNSKISGILVQNSIKSRTIGSSIIGIGININQEVFSNKEAISMKIASLKEFSPNDVLNQFLEFFEDYYLKLQQEKFNELKSEYIESLYRINEKHSFKAHGSVFEGIIIGIDEIGKLLIKSDNVLKSFDYKEVEFLLC